MSDVIGFESRSHLGDPDREVVLWETDFLPWDMTAEGWIDTGVGTNRALTSSQGAPGEIVLTADTSASNAQGTVRRGVTGIELGQFELEMLWRLKVNGAFDGSDDKGIQAFGLNDSGSSLGADVLAIAQLSTVNEKWRLWMEKGAVSTNQEIDVEISGDEIDRHRWWKVLYLPEGGTVGTVKVYTGLQLSQLEHVATNQHASLIPTGSGVQLGPVAFTARNTDTGTNVRTMTIDYTRGVARFRGSRA